MRISSNLKRVALPREMPPREMSPPFASFKGDQLTPFSATQLFPRVVCTVFGSQASTFACERRGRTRKVHGSPYAHTIPDSLSSGQTWRTTQPFRPVSSGTSSRWQPSWQRRPPAELPAWPAPATEGGDSGPVLSGPPRPPPSRLRRRRLPNVVAT